MSSPHDSVSETAHQTCRQRRPTLTQFAGQAGVCLHHDGFIVWGSSALWRAAPERETRIAETGPAMLGAAAAPPAPSIERILGPK